MVNLKSLLAREPAAVGTLVASVLPVLVLFGVLSIDEAQMAAIIVAVNALVGFGVRLVVSPSPVERTGGASAAQRLAS